VLPLHPPNVPAESFPIVYLLYRGLPYLRGLRGLGGWLMIGEKNE
jgi:hypothetical protein